jgi:hypothetical protein
MRHFEIVLAIFMNAKDSLALSILPLAATLAVGSQTVAAIRSDPPVL